VVVRVVVADDSVLLREGLVRLLTEVECEVVAAVEDAPTFLRAVAEQRPDVAIVDVRMPPSMTDDGLRAAVEARASQPDLGILMLSAYVELSYADILLSDGRGRVGYLLKDRVTSLDTLLDALKTISAGGTVLDPEVVAQLLVARRADPLAALSPREKEVLALMAEGRSNAAIAERLVITGGAVEKHISNIFAKINLPDVGADNRRVLAVLAWLRAR
jgi:DNA-binding NarL/FixJ family response regulator